MTAPSTTTKSATSRKAATKAAPAAQAETTETVAEKAEKKTYEAGPARCGKTNRRQSATVLTHAVDVQDTSHPSKLWQAGVITKFFGSEAGAEKYAAAKREQGLDAVVLTAKVVEA